MPRYRLPELPYDYAALEPAISGTIMELHHGAHHAAYVKGANATAEQLAEVRAGGDLGTVPGLERTLAFFLAGHALHSIFWRNLSPDGGDEPHGALAAAIDEFFGGFQRFRAEMTTVTVTLHGSGWGVLAWDPIGQRLVIHQIHDHHLNLAITSMPLLVFDAWEHAFYLQYRNDKIAYIAQLWSLVDWADVGARFEAARAGIPGEFLNCAEMSESG
ncbi:superoxide dismutase [Mycobacterium shigaense]|uniref:Superoxide dismutase n=1 Tax=Mycobacterium shigaense TaxID=722731 RepID=A0A1Z4EBX9_9MYCO|nr:Fe-Mn family superoxide dismutase [Mycobacterium shigaense]MEA1124185.1 Fe-Mn family superoxide dismutase [Mycobacterium shigaense]PRI17287.1 superoxide dismutase [Mycobacterium shigaense]BAX90458.1 superoxide dismutase [Mycobacterium shigaense]